MSYLVRTLAAAMMVVLAACGDSPTEMPDLSVSIVEVGPNQHTLTVGDTMVLTAYPKTADGQILGSVAIQWASANNTIASVTPRGHTSVIRAQAPGTVEVRATSEGKQGKAIVTIVAAPLVVASVDITGGTDTITVGQQLRYDAVVRAADGTAIGGRTVAWQVSTPTIATIAGPADGSYIVVNTHSTGSVTFTATVAGKQKQRTLVVKPVPVPVASVSFEPVNGVVSMHTADTYQLRVRAFAADGSELFGRAVTYSMLDSAIASVSNAGLVKALRVGNTDVTAHVEGKTVTAAIDVRSRIVRVHVNPAALVLGTGEDAQVNATLVDSANGVLNLPVSWRSSNPTVATVDAQGRITAHAPGNAIITPAAEGQEGWVDVRVVEWVTQSLQMIGDSAAPATLWTSTWMDSNGAMHVTRVTARSGDFRMILTGVNSGRYQQRFDVTITTDGQAASYGQYIYNGTFVYDLMFGAFTLSSYNGRQLVARRYPNGELVVTGALEADKPETTFTYRAQ